MRGIKNLSFFLIFILLTACIPEGQRLQRSQASASGNEPSPPGGGGNGGISQAPLFWFTHHKLDGPITLTLDSLSPFFLRGSVVESFLSHAEAFAANSYCFAFQFPTAPKQQLRLRAVAVEIAQSTGRRERLFRLETTNRADNARVCQATMAGIAAIVAAYHPADLCQAQGQGQGGSGCQGSVLTSTSVQLWRVDSTTQASQITNINVPNEQAMQLYLNGGPTPSPGGGNNGGTSCTDTSCKSMGFDCCLASENQCVNDAGLRPNASSLPGFTQAQAQVAQDPAYYVNWPEIYYVCPQGGVGPIPPNNGNGEEEPDSFQQLVDDYLCQEGELDRCDPDQATVVGKIQKICGCPTSTGTCPHLRYEVKKPQGQITEIFCQNTNALPPEEQDQKVSLNTRSVPHRFFPASNQTDSEQEGQRFFYLDPQAKQGAQNGQFNMNSILGQMTLDLGQARPAQVVPVKFDRIYIISAIRGGYAPCPLCPEDQWFSSLSAHPSTVDANGLVAVGHTTRRDESEQNTTGGNFEDTKFGRACWMPPTMIPFSHKSNYQISTQRLERLETQAAFYINGHQRDWFGFNKGALIGSFDGVTWFAIGDGRRVQARSNQLFLAINSPFGDLASNSNIEVFLHEDNNPQGQVPDYDFDPSVTDPSDPRYNQAASCQQYHQCEVDSDCVTQLGWEYTCSDISRWKTLTPSFDLDAQEKAANQLTRSPATLLVGGLPSGGGQKRCVYRGRGALCQQDVSSLNSRQKKLLTCAPNFHCAPLSEARFNHELAREPNALFNILFGMEANVLGRPPHYLGGKNSLPASVQDNIGENFREALGLSGTPGLCLPGKDITQSTHLAQHQAPDPPANPRTDYISQIGACDSSIEHATDLAIRTSRVQGCPLFDEDGNYIFTDNVLTGSAANATSFITHRDSFLTQNSCGYSSQKDSRNVFASIEAQTLGSLSSLSTKTHAEHACLRRAGSPCFTDLDCTPSRLHAETAHFLGLDFFGGTRGEKDYWTEYLVCGQVQEKPLFGTEDFQDYDITKNRCCRAVGEKLSIAIQRDILDPDATVANPVVNDPDFPIANQFPILGRAQDRRYSRFMPIYKDLLGPLAPPFPYRHFIPVSLAGEYKVASALGQWRAPAAVAGQTCCGGNWVRKFTDDTHDWTRTDRNPFPVENFQCLNYRNDYIFEKPGNVSRANYNADIDRACREAANTGCPQVNFLNEQGFDITTTPTNNPSTLIEVDYSSLNDNQQDTIESEYLGEDLQGVSNFAPSGLRMKPNGNTYGQELTYNTSTNPDTLTATSAIQIIANPPPNSMIGTITPINLATGTRTDQLITQLPNTDRPWLDADRGQVDYHLPAYINLLNDAGKNNLVSVGISYAPVSGANSFLDFTPLRQIWTRATGVTGTIASRVVGGTTFRIQVTQGSQGSHVLRLTCAPCDAADFLRAWPIIEFYPQGTSNYRDTITATSTNSLGMTPGSDLYYLDKLGRLELTGVPEILHEPLYCNSDKSLLVPGLTSRFTTRSDVEETVPNNNYASIVDNDATTGVLSGDDNPNKFVLDKEEIALGPHFQRRRTRVLRGIGNGREFRHPLLHQPRPQRNR